MLHFHRCKGCLTLVEIKARPIVLPERLKNMK